MHEAPQLARRPSSQPSGAHHTALFVAAAVLAEDRQSPEVPGRAGDQLNLPEAALQAQALQVRVGGHTFSSSALIRALAQPAHGGCHQSASSNLQRCTH